jgi:hypothetical protein
MLFKETIAVYTGNDMKRIYRTQSYKMLKTVVRSFHWALRINSLQVSKTSLCYSQQS